VLNKSICNRGPLSSHSLRLSGVSDIGHNERMVEWMCVCARERVIVCVCEREREVI
jgi:hypothetical protein